MQQRARSRRRPALLPLALVLAALPGCAYQFASNPDTPPADLEVAVEARDTSTAAGGMVDVAVTFEHVDRIVRFRAGETVACNGTPLAFAGQDGYVGRVPRPREGGTLRCTYTRAGGSHDLEVPVPVRPVLRTPAPGGQAPRTRSLTVEYVPAGATGVTVGGIGHDPDLEVMVDSHQPDTGTFTGFNTMGFRPGQRGTLRLVRIAADALPGTGFRAARYRYESHAAFPVTWQ
ncbi:MAG TPA: hypothetical protein VF746_08290 [Longimicrobium sp.]